MNQFINYLVIIGSVLLCLILLPLRVSGIELLGIAPHWTVIWLVSWSVKRSVVAGAIAGLVLGMLQDAMTGNSPTHIIPLMIVGILTANLHKDRYVREDFISIALIVFVMVIIAETITVVQYIFQGLISFEAIILSYQKISLASAILSSMWAPVVYYPLNIWWQQMRNN